MISLDLVFFFPSQNKQYVEFVASYNTKRVFWLISHLSLSITVAGLTWHLFNGCEYVIQSCQITYYTAKGTSESITC